MARIGDVWDRTTDVLAGRTPVLAGIAGVGLLLPAVIKAATVGLGESGPAVTAALVTLVLAIVALWARLAIAAVALDPATTGAEARRQALRALPRLIGALLVIGAAGVLLLAPFAWMLTQAGFDWTALSAGGRPAMPVLTGGAMWFTRLYLLALAALAVWVIARIKLLLNPILLIEGGVIGAIGRAVELSRGMTWRLIGVVLLYYVVLWACVLAATAVVGLLCRLALGGGAVTAFLATVAGAAVGTVLDTIAQVFGARLYAAVATPSGEQARVTA